MSEAGIGSLREGSREKPITVRLIRKWRPRQRGHDTCYIFIDEGDAIQAFCAGKDQLAIDQKLQVMMCYQIKGYACTGSDKSTAVLSKNVTIRMGATTSIVLVDDVKAIPSTYFEFGTYADIERMSVTRDEVIDYMGVLESIEDCRTKKSARAYVNLRLTDSSNKPVGITIWEEVANINQIFPRKDIEKANKPAIIAATSLCFNQYSGQYDLQSTPATHVYLNPACPTTTDLLATYNHALAPRADQLHLHATNAERTTVTDILNKSNTLPPEKSYICEGFVLDYVTKEGWYYIGCVKCHGIAHKSDDIWFCTECGDITDIKYKSRVVVLISDNVSNVKATMFDDTLEVLIKTNFHELITKGGYDDNKHLPKPIAETVGQKWFFVLKPQREQYPNAPKFIVKQILPMNAINKPLLLETPPPSTPDPSIFISEQTTTTKKKLDFSGQDETTGISDTKRIRYKD